jgi:hypothetical protein
MMDFSFFLKDFALVFFLTFLIFLSHRKFFIYKRKKEFEIVTIIKMDKN